MNDDHGNDHHEYNDKEDYDMDHQDDDEKEENNNDRNFFSFSSCPNSLWIFANQ